MDVQHTGNPEALARKYRENIVAFRTKEKADFDAWKDALLKCSKELLDKIPYDVSTWKFEEMQSELYKDWPDPDVYERQYQDYVTKVEEINQIAYEFDKEAVALLEKAVQLQAKG